MFLHNKSKRITMFYAKRCACNFFFGNFFASNCPNRRKFLFRIHAKKLKDEETFQIKSLMQEHKCGHQHINAHVTSEYLTERYLEDWRDDPTYKMSAFMKRVIRELGVEVRYYKCYYEKN